MKKLVSITVLTTFLFLLFGLTGGCATQQGYQGAGVGAVLGGVSGALIDRKNPWRGGAIGAGIGALFGGTISDLAAKAANEAAQKAAYENRAVRAETRDGYTIIAEPAGISQQTKCKKVRERIWKDGKELGDKVVEVCEGESLTNTY